MDFEDYAQARTGQLLRFAVVLSNDPGVAEDVVQEVLIRAHVQWQRIGGLPFPHAYVRRMVVNESLSWRRKWGRIEARPDRELDRTVADHGGRIDAREELLAELAKLAPKVRATVVLRFFEDLSIPEIADVLACREVTVRGYLHRGLKALRVELSSPPGGDPPLTGGNSRASSLIAVPSGREEHR